MPDFVAGLKTKLGPLPAWGWGLIVGGGAVVYLRFFRKKKDQTEETPAASDYSLDASNAGLTRPPTGTGIGGASGTPYGGDYDPVTGRTYSSIIADTTSERDEAQTQVESLKSDLAAAQTYGANLYFLNAANEAAKATQSPIVTEPVNPVRPASPPTPVPAAPAKPAAGDVIWHGQTYPDLKVISQRHGIPVSQLTVTKPGPNSKAKYAVAVK